MTILIAIATIILSALVCVLAMVAFVVVGVGAVMWADKWLGE